MKSRKLSTNTSEISERKERKEGDPMCLKVCLKDEKIGHKLRQFKCQNVTELINQPIKEEKKGKINPFSNFKNFKLSFQSAKKRAEDVNKTTLNNDLSIFNNTEVLLDNSFQSTYQNSARSNKSTFKILMNEDYTGYIKILKRIYPSFRFNHYKRINNEYLEYYKKYGAEGDINNRNYLYAETATEAESKGLISTYKPSNLLDILGVQENISGNPETFRIKNDFLERKNCVEINMIKEDLAFKTGVIDKELEHILSVYSKVLYSYISNNLALEKDINDYGRILELKKCYAQKVKANFLIKYLSILKMGHKKSKLKHIINILTNLKELKVSFENLMSISQSNIDNKIKVFSDYKDKTKQKLNAVKVMLANKKYNFLSFIENQIITFENKGEINIIDQLNLEVKKLINLTFIYNNKSNQTTNSNPPNTNTNSTKPSKFDLTPPGSQYIHKNTFYIEENNFLFQDKNNDIFIKFLVLAKNYSVESNGKINELIVSILEIFEIVIRDNIDISSIIESFNDIFTSVVNKNFEVMQNLIADKVQLIRILVECYLVLIANYYYLLYLVESNFGLRIKTFAQTTNNILNTIDNIVKTLSFSTFQDFIYNQRLESFFDNDRQIKDITSKYLTYRKIDWNKEYMDVYQQYISNFYENKRAEIIEKLNKLDFSILNNVEESTQSMLNFLLASKNIDDLKEEAFQKTAENIKSDNKIIIATKEKSENSFILIPQEKNDNDKQHKISEFAVVLVEFLYSSAKNYCLIPYENLKEEVVKEMDGVLTEVLKHTKDTVIANGKINNEKLMTEIEISIYYSDVVILEKSLKIFMGNLRDKEVFDIIEEIKLYCLGGIGEVITQLINKCADEFNMLNFKDYPVFQEGKGYNNYIKNLTVLNLVYKNMTNAFSCEDINNIYTQAFNLLFTRMKKIIEFKGMIEDSTQVSQFRNEMTYFKKAFKLFPLVESKKLKKTINEISLSVNPKMPLSKKEK